MNTYKVIAPYNGGNVASRLAELKLAVSSYLQDEQTAGRTLQYTKIFLSDAQNQYQQLVESELFQDIVSKAPQTIVEQPPLNGSKIAMLIKTSDLQRDFVFQSLRLTPDEARLGNSYLQTMMLFEKYLKGMSERGLDIKTHCVRTWIYVKGIDVNYQGVVKARNDIFRKCGLTIDTHFIASTGIGGASQVREATVAMDFLTYPDIKEEQKKYLQALDHLNPTHEYGVAFERGTRLQLNGLQRYFISGTASIDRFGHVIYLGDVEKQAERLIENIEALLHDGEATLDDIKYFIIYLRDVSDYHVIDRYMANRFPDKPRILLAAKVCRPEWLVEMECIAER